MGGHLCIHWPGDELWKLIEGLEENGLLADYSHLVTGYIGKSTVYMYSSIFNATLHRGGKLAPFLRPDYVNQ